MTRGTRGAAGGRGSSAASAGPQAAPADRSPGEVQPPAETGPPPSDSDSIPGDPEQVLGDPEAVARAICLQQLTNRARSRAELAGTMRKRGVPDDVAMRVLDRFAEVGLIDDAALAQTLAAAQHRERGLAGRAVAAKLRRRGLGDDVVDTAVSGIDADSERARATALVRARQATLANLPAPVQQRRLAGLLARKGYSAALTWEVVGAAVRDAGDTSDEVL